MYQINLNVIAREWMITPPARQTNVHTHTQTQSILHGAAHTHHTCGKRHLWRQLRENCDVRGVRMHTSCLLWTNASRVVTADVSGLPFHERDFLDGRYVTFFRFPLRKKHQLSGFKNRYKQKKLIYHMMTSWQVTCQQQQTHVRIESTNLRRWIVELFLGVVLLFLLLAYLANKHAICHCLSKASWMECDLKGRSVYYNYLPRVTWHQSVVTPTTSHAACIGRLRSIMFLRRNVFKVCMTTCHRKYFEEENYRPMFPCWPISQLIIL